VLLNYGGQARAVYTECFHSALTGRRLRIIGDQAELTAEEATMKLEVSYRYRNEQTSYTFRAPGDGHGGGDEGQLASFVAAIRGTGQTRATGEAGLLAVAVGEAAELARRTGRIVALSEVLG
jgi:predicted dehydrogenase